MIWQPAALNTLVSRIGGVLRAEPARRFTANELADMTGEGVEPVRTALATMVRRGSVYRTPAKPVVYWRAL